MRAMEALPGTAKLLSLLRKDKWPIFKPQSLISPPPPRLPHQELRSAQGRTLEARHVNLQGLVYVRKPECVSTFLKNEFLSNIRARNMFYSWLLRGPILTFNYISCGKPMECPQNLLVAASGSD